MPIQGYTPNRSLIQISSGSTDNWDIWYNQTLDLLDEPSIRYKITAAENLGQGDVAAILDDGFGAKKAYLATSATYTFGDPIGISTETVTAGNPVHLTLAGRVQNNGWSFGASDKTVYLSASGTVTTTTSSLKLGYVISSTAIFLRPEDFSSTGGQTNSVTGASGITNTGDNVNAALAPTYGSSASTICQGNDARLHSQNTDQATNSSSFEIDYTGNSARLLTTGLTANRDFTFPDATTKLVGETAPATVTGDHDYSGGTLRVPNNAGVPSVANGKGDVVFDTANDDLYLGQGGTAWKKMNGGGSSAGFGAYSNLVVKPNATNPAYQLDVDADSITLSSSTLVYDAKSVNLTIDITASGANGLDAGSEANAPYYVYVIYNGTTVAGLLSLSATAPTMPSGYTYKKLVGFCVNNTDILDFYQAGNLYSYTAWQSVASGLSATTPTAQSVAAVVGTDIAKAVQIGMGGGGGAIVAISSSADATSISQLVGSSTTTPGTGTAGSYVLTPLRGGVNVYYDAGSATHVMYVKDVLLNL
ncbi:hypothetical protein MNBD_NITROSPINAE04-865 [hydrothermal vent metagenome]|uniref:Uncharacterized protein n=1 Tax=hydrothermal vent metagenome TaxID=652676 RepID=A0A3B1CE92_9ZZZZ